jgi:hypothetical protein
MKSSLTNMWDNIRSSVNSTPKAADEGLQPELTPLTELVQKGKRLKTLEDLTESDKQELKKF